MYRLTSLTTRCRGAALGAALVILATGCAEIEAVRFSSPRYPGAHTEPFAWRDAMLLRAPTDAVTIHVPDGFDVTVQASNRQPEAIAVGVVVPMVPWPPGILRLVRPSAAPPPLQIWLTVGPAAGAEFDLTRVLLIAADGASTSPSSVEGKLCDERDSARGPGKTGRDCNVTSHLPSLAVARLSIERSVVLVLSFPVEASPERSFTLRVDGLASGGVPIAPLDIRFEPATAWVMFSGL